jgi:hypothetical protein
VTKTKTENVLRIDFYIPPTTIDLENSRDPDTLSWEELIYWTFETQINFVEATSEKSLLALPEAALFQILFGLSSARKQIIENVNAEIKMRDREGSYDLVIKHKGDKVKISNEFGEERFQVGVSNFLESTESFTKLAINEVEKKFPTIILNRNYQELKTACL